MRFMVLFIFKLREILYLMCKIFINLVCLQFVSLFYCLCCKFRKTSNAKIDYTYVIKMENNLRQIKDSNWINYKFSEEWYKNFGFICELMYVNFLLRLYRIEQRDCEVCFLNLIYKAFFLQNKFYDEICPLNSIYLFCLILFQAKYIIFVLPANYPK